MFTRAEGLGVPETTVAVQPAKRTTLGVDKEGQAPCLLPLQYRAFWVIRRARIPDKHKQHSLRPALNISQVYSIS